MTAPLKYFNGLMDAMFSNKENCNFVHGIDTRTDVTELAWDEISEALSGVYTSSKFVVFPPLTDHSFSQFSEFMRSYKFDIERDYEKAIHIKMSVRKRPSYS